jgi:DNA-binding GntR family transcriptional regulator
VVFTRTARTSGDEVTALTADRILYTIFIMLNKPPVISKKPLREDVHALLRERIVKGDILPGNRLQDVQLAGELGVSRTPIREALLRLEREGLVESDPNRGFFVAQLSRKEVLETYPIVWALECLALETAEPPTSPQIQALRQINEEMAATADPLHRQELDSRWHQTLLESCPNERLKGFLAALKQIVRRYECVYMSDPDRVRRSVRDHAEILDSLVKRRRPLASRLLEGNWRAGMDSVLAQLNKPDQGIS